MLVALYRMFGVKQIMKKLTHKVIRLPDTAHCSGACGMAKACRWKPRKASLELCA